MRALHKKIAEHVDQLILSHGDKTFYKNDIIEMVKESLNSDGGFTEFEVGQVDMIVANSHV